MLEGGDRKKVFQLFVLGSRFDWFTRSPEPFCLFQIIRLVNSTENLWFKGKNYRWSRLVYFLIFRLPPPPPNEEAQHTHQPLWSANTSVSIAQTTCCHHANAASHSTCRFMTLHQSKNHPSTIQYRCKNRLDQCTSKDHVS